MAGAEITVAGELNDPELDELSGLAASRRHPGSFWAHNDSGDTARLFLIDDRGRVQRSPTIPDAENVDWEDMAVGPGPDGQPHLFIGDIGQNVSLREPAIVYRIAESDTDDVDQLDLYYPDGPADAETLMVDPDTGELVVITKSLDGRSRILTADQADSPITMTEAGAVTFTDPGPVEGSLLPGTMLTGGDIAPDGSFIVLRTYKEVLIYPREPGWSIAKTLQQEPCRRTVENEPQGEAVAVTLDSAAIVTISEFGLDPDPPVPVHRIDIGEATSTIDSTEPSEPAAPAADENSDRTAAVVLVVAAMASVAVVGFVIGRRSSA